MTAFEVFVSGRTEIAGNHVDHQGGLVVTSAVGQGITGVVEPNGQRSVRVFSDGFESFQVDLNALAVGNDPAICERGTSLSLVKGMLCELGLISSVPGFDLHVTSTLPVGGGLSSSAAFEVLVGRAALKLAGKTEESVELAKAAQRAESCWFGKPCGLMDQVAVACGGVNVIDFADPASPQVKPLSFDFKGAGYDVVLVDTGIRHDGPQGAADYASIPSNMFAVANALGASRLRDVEEAAFRAASRKLASELGEVAVKRASHYFDEMRLVRQRIDAMEAGDMDAFLQATAASSTSNKFQLFNIGAAAPILDGANRLLRSLATEEGCGVARIHGGGFGGSIQAYVPVSQTQAFVAAMGNCAVLTSGKGCGL